MFYGVKGNLAKVVASLQLTADNKIPLSLGDLPSPLDSSPVKSEEKQLNKIPLSLPLRKGTSPPMEIVVRK
jgi:hypothetical protein